MSRIVRNLNAIKYIDLEPRKLNPTHNDKEIISILCNAPLSVYHFLKTFKIQTYEVAHFIFNRFDGLFVKNTNSLTPASTHIYGHMLKENFIWAVTINGEWMQYMRSYKSPYDIVFAHVTHDFTPFERTWLLRFTIEEKSALFWAAMYSGVVSNVEVSTYGSARPLLTHHCDYIPNIGISFRKTWVSHPKCGMDVKFRRRIFNHFAFDTKSYGQEELDEIVDNYGIRGILTARGDTFMQIREDYIISFDECTWESLMSNFPFELFGKDDKLLEDFHFVRDCCRVDPRILLIARLNPKCLHVRRMVYRAIERMPALGLFFGVDLSNVDSQISIMVFTPMPRFTFKKSKLFTFADTSYHFE
jgi:hypothetical protein